MVALLVVVGVLIVVAMAGAGALVEVPSPPPHRAPRADPADADTPADPMAA